MAIDLISFSIPITPKPKQADRSRIVVPKAGKMFVHHYQPSSVTDAARDMAALIAPCVPDKPIEGPVFLSISFGYPWRVSETKAGRATGWKYKDTLPDLDNLEKMICDVLERVGFFKNDSQIARKLTDKHWCDSPSIDITIEKLEV